MQILDALKTGLEFGVDLATKAYMVSSERGW